MSVTLSLHWKVRQSWGLPTPLGLWDLPAAAVWNGSVSIWNMGCAIQMWTSSLFWKVCSTGVPINVCGIQKGSWNTYLCILTQWKKYSVISLKHVFPLKSVNGEVRQEGCWFLWNYEFICVKSELLFPLIVDLWDCYWWAEHFLERGIKYSWYLVYCTCKILLWCHVDFLAVNVLKMTFPCWSSY